MRHRAHPTLTVLAGALACFAMHATAVAAPTLRVRATTTLQLHAHLTEEGARIEGTLRDDVGAALGGKPLRFAFEPQSVAPAPAGDTRTDASGAFRVTTSAARERVLVRVAFDGDEYYERCAAYAELDPTLADLRLQLVMPGGTLVVLGAAPVTLEVRAVSAAGGASIAMKISDELGRELARGTTDLHGVLRTTLATQELGAPGMGRLIASAEKSSTRGAARAELAILRKLETRLQLTAALEAGEPRAELVITGSLDGSDDENTGLAHKAVALLADGETIATILTDAHGAFERRLQLEAGASGRSEIFVSARFEPDAPWLGASLAPAIRLELPSQEGPNAAWLMLPVGLSLVLAIWLAIRVRARVPAPIAPRASSPGVRAGPARKRGPLSNTSVTGRIEDAATGLPLMAARVRLQRAERVERTLEASDGTFDMQEVPQGSYALIVEADGYSGVSAPVHVPHAGESSDLRIGLASLRELALDAHRDVAERLLAGERLTHLATPRDAMLLARQHRPASRDIATLTVIVEQVAYSQATPTATDLQQVEHVAHAALGGGEPPEPRH